MSGEILAVLPAYNEEVSIGSIVLHARQHDLREIPKLVAPILRGRG